MAQTRSSITAHAALVAVLAVAAVLCLTGAKPSAACKLGKSNCLPPIVPPAPTPGMPPPAVVVRAADGNGKCPVDVAKLGVCASVLDALIHAVLGGAAPPPSREPCCALIAGLADVDAAVCVCLAIKASVLGDGVKLDDVAVDLPLLVNYCGRDVPEGFKCA